MNRRRALGLLGAGLLGGLAGCTGGPADSSTPTPTPTPSAAPVEHHGTLDGSFPTNGAFPADDEPADGYPPAFDERPAAPDADPSAFDTQVRNGETVRLVPIDVAYDWYRRGEARVVDARGLDSYEQAHVYGAVLSTFQEESTGGGIEGWDPADRVVTYCTCPHHMSTVRAAGLQKAGFADVFAIDEGFRPWFERGYPMAGSAFASDSRAQVSEWTIRGVVPAVYAGRSVVAAAGRQYEAGPVRADGSYTLGLRFWNVDAATPVALSTPAYTVTRPLGELAAGTVRGPER